MKAPHLFFYIQHLLGIGHQVRAKTLASACADAGFHVDLADGGINTGSADPSTGIVRHPLPVAKAADAAFSGVVDVDGNPIDEAWKTRRRDRLLALFAETRPDLLLIEGFPFARRAFRFELVPLLQAARDAGVPAAVSVRDIIQPKRPDRVPEVLDWLDRYVDLVLVHGDAALIPFSVSFPAAGRITPRLVHTGYVSATTPRPATADRTGVVVSGGGGAVASGLFDAAAEAAKRLDGRYGKWRLLVGPNHPAAHADHLRRMAIAGDILVEPARADFRALLQTSAVSVSQAGYNTATDLLATATPAVLVPFEEAGQKEQRLRADRLEAAGRAVTVGGADVSAAELAGAVETAAALRPNIARPVAMDGAARSARELRMLLEGGGDDG
ncbi:MAG: glycosyltransferase [Alphaproteobacteria bacterium]